jgi:hypothetical protein
LRTSPIVYVPCPSSGSGPPGIGRQRIIFPRTRIVRLCVLGRRILTGHRFTGIDIDGIVSGTGIGRMAFYDSGLPINLDFDWMINRKTASPSRDVIRHLSDNASNFDYHDGPFELNK